MTNTNEAVATTQVYRVYIKATPAQIWEAITKPEWTVKFGYGGYVNYDLRPGGKFHQRSDEAMKAYGNVPDVIIDGEVVEADPPRRLVQTWRMLMDPAEIEDFTKLTYEIEETPSAGTRLTITHDLTGSPRLAAMVAGRNEAEGAGGGWNWVLSDLKTVLETGTSIRG